MEVSTFEEAGVEFFKAKPAIQPDTTK